MVFRALLHAKKHLMERLALIENSYECLCTYFPLHHQIQAGELVVQYSAGLYF